MLKRLLFAALLAPSIAHTQELVTNGGFETGDFSGWTVLPGACALVTSSAAQAGNFGVSSGNPSDGCSNGFVTLTQWLDPIPNRLYELSFNFMQVDNPDKINCPYAYRIQCRGIAESIGQGYGLGYFRIYGFSGPPIESEFDWGTTNSYQVTYRLPFLLTGPIELGITLFNPMSFWYLDNVSVHELVGDPVTVRPPYAVPYYQGPDVSSTWPSIAVPEPSTLVLLVAGLALVAIRRRLSAPRSSGPKPASVRKPPAA